MQKRWREGGKRVTQRDGWKREQPSNRPEKGGRKDLGVNSSHSWHISLLLLVVLEEMSLASSENA